MKNKTTLLFSALAAAALLAGCRTTQNNHAGRGLLDDGPAEPPATRVRPAAAPVAATVSEKPLAAQPQPVAVQPAAYQPKPAAYQPKPAAYQPQPVVVQPQTAPAKDVQAGKAANAAPAAVPAWTPPAAPAGQPVPAQPAKTAATPAATPAEPACETYVVKSGDIAGRIANSHGMTFKEFLQANDMTADQAGKLHVGQKVKVWAGAAPLASGPAVQRGTAPAVSDDPNVYVVQSGDTLLAISAKTGVPVATLMKNNGIDNPNTIRVGQKLVLKKGAAVAPVQPTTLQPTTQPPVQPTTTKKGGKKGGSKQTPTAADPVTPVVVPGEPVAAPPPPKPQQDASVPLDQVPVAGTDKSLEDLLGGLSLTEAREQAAEKKETAARQVQEAVEAAKSAADDAAGAVSDAPAGFKYYTVKEGENLYHLTARFKVPLAKLRELNNLPKTASKLDPGTRLLVPDAAAVAP